MSKKRRINFITEKITNKGHEQVINQIETRDSAYEALSHNHAENRKYLT